jgi:hypothetical protein
MTTEPIKVGRNAIKAFATSHDTRHDGQSGRRPCDSYEKKPMTKLAISKGPKKLLEALKPTAFENLSFDLVTAAGLQNAVWRTPGADGGRDIEATMPVMDISGEVTHQKWYIECKRYKHSLAGC